MTATYFETVLLIERLHRHFLDVVKVELDRRSIEDINNVQALILYNVGDDDLTVGELTLRGYYLGSNVSYNVKKMVENGYLLQERSTHDRRSVRVRLSEKGLGLRNSLTEVFEKHVKALTDHNISVEALSEVNVSLRRLERFWTNMADFAMRAPRVAA